MQNMVQEVLKRAFGERYGGGASVVKVSPEHVEKLRKIARQMGGGHLQALEEALRAGDVTVKLSDPAREPEFDWLQHDIASSGVGTHAAVVQLSDEDLEGEDWMNAGPEEENVQLSEEDEAGDWLSNSRGL